MPNQLYYYHRFINKLRYSAGNIALHGSKRLIYFDQVCTHATSKSSKYPKREDEKQVIVIMTVHS